MSFLNIYKFLHRQRELLRTNTEKLLHRPRHPSTPACGSCSGNLTPETIQSGIRCIRPTLHLSCGIPTLLNLWRIKIHVGYSIWIKKTWFNYFVYSMYVIKVINVTKDLKITYVSSKKSVSIRKKLRAILNFKNIFWFDSFKIDSVNFEIS